MKFTVGLTISSAVGVGYRYFDVPVDSLAAIPGTLILLAMTAGYSWTNEVLKSRNKSSTTTHLCGDMISTPELRPQFLVGEAVLIPICYEECSRQTALAERELSAYLRAVQALYGEGVVACAADDWIAFAGSAQAPSALGFLNWMYITIHASSRLAMDQFG